MTSPHPRSARGTYCYQLRPHAFDVQISSWAWVRDGDTSTAWRMAVMYCVYLVLYGFKMEMWVFEGVSV